MKDNIYFSVYALKGYSSIMIKLWIQHPGVKDFLRLMNLLSFLSFGTSCQEDRVLWVETPKIQSCFLLMVLNGLGQPYVCLTREGTFSVYWRILTWL